MGTSCGGAQAFFEGSKATREAPMLDSLFKDLRKRDTPEGKAAWLGKMVDLDKQIFKAKAGKIVLLPDSAIAKFQKVVDKYLFSGVSFLATITDPEKFFKVLSVAQKLGSGTGSIGLNRYWVLLQVTCLSVCAARWCCVRSRQVGHVGLGGCRRVRRQM